MADQPNRSSAPGAAPDLVVVGGGIVGLAVARALANEGLTVTLVERDRPGAESSWAAAGMLIPLGESEEGPFRELVLASHRAWPLWARELEADAERSVDFRASGRMVLALDEPRAEALREGVRALARSGHAVEWLDAATARAREPGLAEAVRGAALHLEDAHVDNRRVGPALEAAALRVGVRVERAEARSLHIQHGRIQGVHLLDGRLLPTPRVVVAAGAWSGQLEGVHPGLAVRPVRGRMIALRPPGPLPERILDTGTVYLVPRGGRILVGATMEDAGFDRSPDPRASAALLAGAVAALPDLAGLPLDEEWQGFRPGTPDGLPYLGPDPAIEGLFYATGHFRNGILLAPLTAALLRDLVLGRSVESPPAFRVDRG
ncbi:MAG: glycine oxidase ThiO [Gemmatimonadetes bacterium]|nr:glycine oxidase ThiO [Gemmatimonadota bacterium]